MPWRVSQVELGPSAQSDLHITRSDDGELEGGRRSSHRRLIRPSGKVVHTSYPVSLATVKNRPSWLNVIERMGGGRSVETW